MSTGAARKIKEENPDDLVDYVIGFQQIESLLNFNPHIDNVFVLANPTPLPLHNVRVGTLNDEYSYDMEYQLSETTKLMPPPFQFQLECDVKNPDTQFEVWTDPEVDKEVDEWSTGKPIVAVMERTSWLAKAFRFTPEEYSRGIDVSFKGYGGRLRDIFKITDELALALPDYDFVEVGLHKDVSTIKASDKKAYRSMSWDASLLKRAEYFIGAEGGLANLASGVGTKTILTGEFVQQLYGWNGVIKKCDEPKLGPRYYFLDVEHIDLNPYLEDDEVIEEFTAVISGKKTAKDFKYDWFR
jgi:hypothetical protein